MIVSHYHCSDAKSLALSWCVRESLRVPFPVDEKRKKGVFVFRSAFSGVYLQFSGVFVLHTNACHDLSV